jgi:hypothetical protein
VIWVGTYGALALWLSALIPFAYQQHIHRKIGSSTRAAASLFAMQQGLLPELDGSPEDGANAR